ncbi:ArsR/SmtB family transcription factor [Microbulbifer variabilis]|uniref:ArsR/SmtB family transcription factor n=1 Tax=Microbulbifer variabilis TaxID=266805 RepID=UPI001CFDED50|nr:helix-turn-helix domain-containing protein [Microbulbifer variabilis]
MDPDISLVAGLIGDKTRSKMLMALMGGKALTATELACESDISAQTASTHLSKLTEGGLLVVRKQGRHKYFQLRDHEVAEILEKLLNIGSAQTQRSIDTGPSNPDLRKARICYDHLAGSLGVALYDSLMAEGAIIEEFQSAELTDKGKEFFSNLGVDIEGLRNSRRPLCKSCLDWSERRNHLAGILGQWILEDAFRKKWARKRLDSRVIDFSNSGLKKFLHTYRVSFKI